MTSVAAVLLAGGRSRRMGRDKPLLRLAGETLVERHLRQLRAAGVGDAVVVANEENEGALEALGMGCPVVRQRRESMTGAVRDGLAAVRPDGPVYLVCVNDIVRGDAYQAIEARAAAGDADVVMAAARVERPFRGGVLALDGDRVESIVENPPGGIPLGAWANVMIHRWARVDERLLEALGRGEEYEAAVSGLTGGGLRAAAVALDFWIAVKTPGDWELARALVQ